MTCECGYQLVATDTVCPKCHRRIGFREEDPHVEG